MATRCNERETKPEHLQSRREPETLVSSTPVEMRAGHENVQQPPMSVESDVHETLPATAEYSQPRFPTMHDGSQETKKQQESAIASPYPSPPPPEEHPANYAPYADDVRTQGKDDSTQEPQYSYNAPPNPPVPPPTKAGPGAFDEPRNDISVTLAPDVNPLQSPQSPRSPPPVTTTPADIAAYHHIGQISQPDQGVTGGTWNHGLCDCSEIGTCCLGLLCPCILYGRTQHRLLMRSRKEDPTNLLGHETCNGSCIAMAVLCGCQWFMATAQHSRIRRSYGIQGDVVSDCVRATCCTCCTLIQDEKEIQEREEKRRSAVRRSGAMLAEPYAPPGTMAYPPPPTHALRT